MLGKANENGLNNEQIQEIKQRHEAATQGSWNYVETDDEQLIIYDDTYFNRHIATIVKDGVESREREKANAELIIYAREDVAYLLSEVERLQTENERLSNEMDSMMISLEDRDPYAASKYWTYLLDEKNQLVKALRWYADDLNYKLGNQTILGEKARTALSHLRGE